MSATIGIFLFPLMAIMAPIKTSALAHPSPDPQFRFGPFLIHPHPRPVPGRRHHQLHQLQQYSRYPPRKYPHRCRPVRLTQPYS